MQSDKSDSASSKPSITIVGPAGSDSRITELHGEDLASEIADALREARVSPSDKDKVSSVIVGLLRRHEYHSGPLPSASQFQSYEDACPGSGTRILAMAEREQAHRHDWEILEARREHLYSAMGLWMGFLLALGLILAAIFCAVTGHEYVAGGFIAASAVSMVPRFIDGRRRSSESLPPEEPQEKSPSNSRMNSERRTRRKK